MKASGPRIERETVITWNDEDQDAEIWTASDSINGRCRKAKLVLLEDGEHHAVYRLPKRLVSIRTNSGKKPMSAEKRAALASQFALGRKTLQSTGE